MRAGVRYQCRGRPSRPRLVGARMIALFSQRVRLADEALISVARSTGCWPFAGGLLLCAGVVLALPESASAHVRTSVVAVDYRARVLPLHGRLRKAVAVRVYAGDLAPGLTVRRGHAVVVLGYAGEPFCASTPRASRCVSRRRPPPPPAWQRRGIVLQARDAAGLFARIAGRRCGTTHACAGCRPASSAGGG
jgi:hypothetical protein